MEYINLADSNVRTIATFLALLWGVGVAAAIYSLFADIRDVRADRKPRPQRRFIEPCADGLHLYEEGTCTTCKAEEPPSTE